MWRRSVTFVPTCLDRPASPPVPPTPFVSRRPATSRVCAAGLRQRWGRRPRELPRVTAAEAAPPAPPDPGEASHGTPVRDRGRFGGRHRRGRAFTRTRPRGRHHGAWGGVPLCILPPLAPLPHRRTQDAPRHFLLARAVVCRTTHPTHSRGSRSPGRAGPQGCGTR